MSKLILTFLILLSIPACTSRDFTAPEWAGISREVGKKTGANQ